MKNTGKTILHTVIWFAAVVALSWFLITFVAQRTDVNGTSMVPTLEDGDQLIADKLSYHFRDPERFDIVIFPYQYAANTYFIKRVIGLPGETIQIKDGQILIDGETYQENGEFPGIENAGVAETKVVLDSGEYFVLGDNRNNSIDSRSPDVGIVRKSQNIIGKVWFIASPWSRFGFV